MHYREAPELENPPQLWYATPDWAAKICKNLKQFKGDNKKPGAQKSVFGFDTQSTVRQKNPSEFNSS